MKSLFSTLKLMVVCLLAILLGGAVFGAETNQEAAQLPNPEIGEMRKQLETIQRASEEAGAKWESLLLQNNSLSNRLADLQQNLAAEKQRQTELARQADAFHLRVLAGAAVAVFLVFALSYWFQLRCFNRIIEISRSFPALPPGSAAPLLEDENSPTHRLLGAVKLLEQRLQELEGPGAKQIHPPNSTAIFADEPAAGVTQIPTENGAVSSGNGSRGNLSMLMSKGQIFLDTDRLQEAVVCFQEALEISPGHADAHLKKGMALERMNKLEQSLACYDEALKLNPSKAVAYVYKARVLQGLNRHDEALLVYDSAMGKTRSGAATATGVGI